MMGKWTGLEGIPLDDLPAPPANLDRKMRIQVWDPNTWPGLLVGLVFLALVLAAASIAH